MKRVDVVSTVLELAGAGAVTVGVGVLCGSGWSLVVGGVLAAGFGWLLGGAR